MLGGTQRASDSMRQDRKRSQITVKHSYYALLHIIYIKWQLILIHFPPSQITAQDKNWIYSNNLV